MCESVLCLFRLPALFVCHFEPINNPSWSSSKGIINLTLSFYFELLFSHKMTLRAGQTLFSFNFVVWVWWQTKTWLVLCNLLVKCARDYIPEKDPRRGCSGHDDSCAIVQTLFGLAELSKSRIYPQYDTEPANLSWGIRKSPELMWFMGSQRSPHFSVSYLKVEWIQHVLFILSCLLLCLCYGSLTEKEPGRSGYLCFQSRYYKCKS